MRERENGWKQNYLFSPKSLIHENMFLMKSEALERTQKHRVRGFSNLAAHQKDL